MPVRSRLHPISDSCVMIDPIRGGGSPACAAETPHAMNTPAAAMTGASLDRLVPKSGRTTTALSGFHDEVDERLVTVGVAVSVDDDVEGLAGGDGGAEDCEPRGLAESEVAGSESGRALIDEPADAVMFVRAPGFVRLDGGVDGDRAGEGAAPAEDRVLVGGRCARTHRDLTPGPAYPDSGDAIGLLRAVPLLDVCVYRSEVGKDVVVGGVVAGRAAVEGEPGCVAVRVARWVCGVRRLHEFWSGVPEAGNGERVACDLACVARVVERAREQQVWAEAQRCRCACDVRAGLEHGAVDGAAETDLRWRGPVVCRGEVERGREIVAL